MEHNTDYSFTFADGAHGTYTATTREEAFLDEKNEQDTIAFRTIVWHSFYTPDGKNVWDDWFRWDFEKYYLEFLVRVNDDHFMYLPDDYTSDDIEREIYYNGREFTYPIIL